MGRQAGAGRMPASAGARELRDVRKRVLGLFWPAAVFSTFVNLLGLTGSLYMLQVYDRVIPGHSVPTLVALSLLALAMFVAMGVLDHYRARLLARAGVRFQACLDPRIFLLTVTRPARIGEGGNAGLALQDLEAIQKLLSGPAPRRLHGCALAAGLCAAAVLYPLVARCGRTCVGGGADRSCGVERICDPPGAGGEPHGGRPVAVAGTGAAPGCGCIAGARHARQCPPPLADPARPVARGADRAQRSRRCLFRDLAHLPQCRAIRHAGARGLSGDPQRDVGAARSSPARSCSAGRCRRSKW